MHPMKPFALTAIAALLAGCAVGPHYQRPSAPTPASYKEASGWVAAAPADTLERGQWWTLFDDPVLSALEAKVLVSNQNIAAASAAYAQARALVREQRAGLFPSVTLDAGAKRSGSGGANSAPGNNFQIGLGANWEPDVWGRLQRAVESGDAGAQASAADLASATLAAQCALATSYFSLRQTDAQQALLEQTIVGYRRAQEITQNRYAVGIVTKTDVLQAQTQLANAQADSAGLTRQRAQYEHALATLTGQAAGDFSVASAAWTALVPEIPLGIPSVLLQRRPDIASAERHVAAANAQIGIVSAGYYPSLNLSASGGVGAAAVADLFKASSSVWSLGLSAAQTLFNAGATRAKVDQAEAAQQQAVARYRQSVLAAFADVEDQLSATRALQQQQLLRAQASSAADQVETQVLNRYRSGQVSYTDVVTAQATALSARRALVQVMADRQSTAVALIQSLGGGWHAELMAPPAR